VGTKRRSSGAREQARGVMRWVRTVLATLCGTVVASACGMTKSTSGSPEGGCLERACGIPLQGADAGSTTCDERLSTVAERYYETLTPADTPANEACATDADCVPSPSLSCGNPCGLPFLSRTGAAAVESQLAPLELELCDAYFSSGCPEPGFHCPHTGAPTCVIGRCWNGQGTPGSNGEAVSCGARTHQLWDWTDAVMRWADRTCGSDDDCTTVGLDNRCYHGCAGSLPVSKSGAAEIRVGLTKVETALCPAFEAAGCTADAPPCEPLPKPECLGGFCQWI
jgi:hypothetical protein